MGLVSWLLAALSAFALARIIPSGRSPRWWIELAAALIAGPLLGGVATSLDFGGWNELSWPAAALAFAGTFALLGLGRLAAR
jgi:hypothetical protein